MLCQYNVDIMNICMKEYISFVELRKIIPLYGFCICMGSAFMGRSTPTTAFDGAI